MGESKKRKGSKAPKHHKKKSSRRERSRSKSRRKASSPSPVVAATPKPEADSAAAAISRDSDSTKVTGVSKNLDTPKWTKAVESEARSRSQSWSPVRREEENSEADSFWAQQASAWVSNRTSDKGVAGLMTLIATQAAVQMASTVKPHAGTAKAPPPPPPPPPCVNDKSQGNMQHFSPFAFNAAVQQQCGALPPQHSGGPPVGMPIPPPPPPAMDRQLPLAGVSGHEGAFPFVPGADASALCGFGSAFEPSAGAALPFGGPRFGDTASAPQPKSKTIPQWLRDVVCEANSQKKEVEGGGAPEPDKGQLLTPSPKTGSPREASPEASKEEPPVTDPALLLEEIKGVVTDILAEVSDEIFSEAACEAISNQRRKQRIACKTTIGLKLQGAAPQSQAKQNTASLEKVQAVAPLEAGVGGVRKASEEPKSAGVLNRLAVSLGAYRCPVNATPPPSGVFEITIFEDGLELTRVPFNGTHILFGNSSKLANVIDQHASVAGQQCAIYYSTKQLHQQETIKADLAESKSRRSVNSYISKHKTEWINWEPESDCGVVLNAGDQRLALNEQRSCFVLGNSRRVYYLNLTDMCHRLLVAEGKAKERTDSRKGHDRRKRRRSRFCGRRCSKDRRGRERSRRSTSRLRSRKGSRSSSSSEQRNRSSPRGSPSTGAICHERRETRNASDSRSSGSPKSRSASSASARQGGSGSREASCSPTRSQVFVPQKASSGDEYNSGSRSSDRNCSSSCSPSGSRMLERRSRNIQDQKERRSSSVDLNSSSKSTNVRETRRKASSNAGDLQMNSGSDSEGDGGFASPSASRSRTHGSMCSASSQSSRGSPSRSVASSKFNSDSDRSGAGNELADSRQRGQSRESSLAKGARDNLSKSRSASPGSSRNGLTRSSGDGRSLSGRSARSPRQSLSGEREKRSAPSSGSSYGRQSSSASRCSGNVSVGSNGADDSASDASSSCKSPRSGSASASGSSRSLSRAAIDLVDTDRGHKTRHQSSSRSSRGSSSAASKSASQSSVGSRSPSKVSSGSLKSRTKEEDLVQGCTTGSRQDRLSPGSRSRSGSGSVESAPSKSADRSSSEAGSEVSETCTRSSCGRRSRGDSSASGSRQSYRRSSSGNSSRGVSRSSDGGVDGHERASAQRSSSYSSNDSKQSMRKGDVSKQVLVDKQKRNRSGIGRIENKRKESTGFQRTGRDAEPVSEYQSTPSVVELSEAESFSEERHQSLSKRRTDRYRESRDDVRKVKSGVGSPGVEKCVSGKRGAKDGKSKGSVGAARKRVSKETGEFRKVSSAKRTDVDHGREAVREKQHDSSRTNKLGNAEESSGKRKHLDIKKAPGRFDRNKLTKNFKDDESPNPPSQKRSHGDTVDGDENAPCSKKTKIQGEKAVDSESVKRRESKVVEKKSSKAKGDRDKKRKSSRSKKAE